MGSSGPSKSTILGSVMVLAGEEPFDLRVVGSSDFLIGHFDRNFDLALLKDMEE